MNDPFIKSFLSANFKINPQRRYSDPALRVTVMKYTRHVQDRADKNPGWLTPKTLHKLDSAVRRAETALSRASFPKVIAKRRRQLFYTVAHRDAFRIVLGVTDPKQLDDYLPDRVYRDPAVAKRLATWRYERRWRSKRLEQLLVTYQQQRLARGKAQLAYEQARASVALAQREIDMERAGRRMLNPNARAERGSKARLDGLKAVARTARRQWLDAEHVWRVTREQVRRLRERVAVLEARIAENEK